MVESLLKEAAELPECPPEVIPNYFTTEGVLDTKALPAYLAGMKVTTAEISVSAIEYSRFIHETMIMCDRSSLITTDGTPGCVEDFTIDI